MKMSKMCVNIYISFFVFGRASQKMFAVADTGQTAEASKRPSWKPVRVRGPHLKFGRRRRGGTSRECGQKKGRVGRKKGSDVLRGREKRERDKSWNVKS